MHSIAWWPSFGAVIVASIIDLYTRRIPNWLVVPFLAAGVIVRTVTEGLPGMWSSLAGIGFAVLLFGLPCFLRAMGMGDLKLAAGVGAWIGPEQFLMAFIVTGMVGGIMAAGYALRHRSLGQCLDRTGDLLWGRRKPGNAPRPDIRLAHATRLAIPYAPAIAIGTLFSFFTR